MRPLFLTLALSLGCSVSFAQSAATSDNAIAERYEPPMIPHAVAAFLPITPEKNACLMCHKVPTGDQKKVKGAPTPLPPSHVYDSKVNPNRYECMLCHAEVLPEKK